jgi:5-hydroxyisourate hydrolase-like protein (transthyretin family)
VLSASGLEPGSYRLRISGAGFAARLTDPFPVGEGESRDLGPIRLEAGGGLAGRVTDEAGAPVEGIGVSVRNAKGEEVFLFNMVSTGSNGRYELQALELGRYTVKFEGKGYAPVEKSADVGSQGAVVDAVLLRGGTVVIRVVDEAGQPIQGARVVLHDASGAEVHRTLSIVTAFEDVSRTDAQGQARIRDLALGGYRATARKTGLVAAGDPAAFTVSAGGEVAVIVVLKPAP